MNTTELITIYEKVDQLTSNMLIAAQNQNWDLLSELEMDCSGQVCILRENELPTPLPAELKNKKINIIKSILAKDKAIRELTEPWMLQLSNLMKNSNNSRKLTESYGANNIG